MAAVNKEKVGFTISKRIHDYSSIYTSELMAVKFCIENVRNIDQKTLMVISFLQRRCHPVTWCIKKIADQPC